MSTLEDQARPKIAKMIKKYGLQIVLKVIIDECKEALTLESVATLTYLTNAYAMYKTRHQERPSFSEISTHSRAKSVIDDDMEDMMRGFGRTK